MIRREVQIGDCKCVECGKSYRVPPYRRATTKFCSQECGGRFRVRETLNKGPKAYMRGNRLRAGLRPANAFTPEQEALL